ncbi:3940_t:CDS:2 [Paraglomus occultum]|uniref:Histone H4 n=1 Tax=Paraglomus occultum TaxID=144539 RepID=A0A9N9G2X1_9GLOM|nr:3940_t:CDS:2 [Paraglomus occultum]
MTRTESKVQASIGRGLGKNTLLTPKRHRKILRENIKGITQTAIRRLARRGGVKRMSYDSYEEVRQALKAFLRDILKDVIVYCEHQGKKTATLDDVFLSLKRRGKVMYGFSGDASAVAREAVKERSKKRELGMFKDVIW